VIPDVLSGRKISALGITEPGGGSDVAGLRTTARRDGDHYVIDGEKTFITSGMRADWFTLAVRTDPENKGAGGISMIAVPGDVPGLTRARLRKMGWLCSDTALLHFEGARVPVANLIGEEGKGFRMIMTNFNAERISIAAMALGMAECCYDEALAWARDRRTFGRALIEHQVVRHKLVDMKMRVESTRAWLKSVSDRADANQVDAEWVADVCMLKNHSTQAMQFCADQAVQILGGMGYMRGTASERIYREVKVAMIGGGAEEIMKELAARQLGI
jgi:acyl-CoA dehydrogenase